LTANLIAGRQREGSGVSTLSSREKAAEDVWRRRPVAGVDPGPSALSDAPEPAGGEQRHDVQRNEHGRVEARLTDAVDVGGATLDRREAAAHNPSKAMESAQSALRSGG
jgi:hypothetical protein